MNLQAHQHSIQSSLPGDNRETSLHEGHVPSIAHPPQPQMILEQECYSQAAVSSSEPRQMQKAAEYWNSIPDLTLALLSY